MASNPQDLISDDVSWTFQLIVYGLACEAVALLGVVTNIINIICFIKQGFKDSITVTLTGLAVSDLACMATLLFSNLCYNPLFQELDLPFEPTEVQYLVSGWPHVILTRITSWITAFITLERCLCIAMPLKVKMMITPKRSAVIICIVFLLLVCSGSPIYYTNKLGCKFSSDGNRTVFGLITASEREVVEGATFMLTVVLVPFSAFVVVIVCTVVLVIKLRTQTQLRKKITRAVQSRDNSEREQKLAKMVVVISTLFIVCYFPFCLTFVAMILLPDLSVDGRYKKTLIFFGGFQILLESINSAMNLFIYYHMSSYYRAVFRQLFPLEGCIS